MTIKGKSNVDLDAFLNGPSSDEQPTSKTEEKNIPQKKETKTIINKTKAQTNKKTSNSKSDSSNDFNLQEKDVKETKTFRLSTDIDNRLTDAASALTKKGYKVSKSDLVENALKIYLGQIESKLKL